MDHTTSRASRIGNRSGGGASRLVRHHKGLVGIGVVAAVLAAAYGVRYKRDALHRNEQAQKNSPHPNFYVSVDRSGGGI